MVCIHEWQLRTLTNWVQVESDKWVGSHPDKYAWFCPHCGATRVGAWECLPRQTEYNGHAPARALAVKATA